MNKNLYIISGCNGAGKTTASFAILPQMLNCKEFVNADEIARGLSPFQPDTVAFEAGRIMLRRIEELMEAGETFAFETTLATKSYHVKIKQAQQLGYKVTLLFFCLESIDLAIDRVATRVSEGGHNIHPDVIARRYKGGIRNLFSIYLPIVDEALIFDNTTTPELIAGKNKSEGFTVFKEEKFKRLSNED
ncbi:zeta toxin family protein [uncultured Flavobacterium sp.]|uniref:zeta toxin family protein n=1 Tax=uncultured Flavobacterium sp. TaxID=165435 RepID=UPI0025FC30CC|nr:zeta toxin family protein [uncultured Flavobacterium sp.]